MTKRHLLAMASLACACVPAPRAAVASPWGGWSVSWENDTFVPGQGTDDFYTNGIRFTVGHNGDPKWRWMNFLIQRSVMDAWFHRDSNHDTSYALVIGQNFFTPQIITQFGADPNDRPFAGLLYTGVRIDCTEDEGPASNAFKLRSQRTLELDLGVMGPPALAEQTQKAVHLLRQTRIPKGWDRQLGSELAANAQYLHRVRLGWPSFDVIPQLGAGLGTVQIYSEGGATVRIGHQMRSFPALLNALTADKVLLYPWELAIFAAVNGRAYARNAYLDGNLLGGSPRVAKDAWVYDSRFGASLRVHGWMGTYTLVRRSREFRAQPKLDVGFHNYGSITIGRTF